jgi:hypothetical protein
MEICKGMYGLPQAGILANKLLKECLARHGYFEQPHTLGLWKHVACPVWFNLCVKTFGIKYIGREHLQHLYDALQKKACEIVEDWKSNLYCRITLKWNYEKHHVDLAMPAYVMKQLTKYSHVAPLKPQHCPYSPNLIKYGKDNQSLSPLDESPWLDRTKKKRIHQIVGSFLYYAQAVDPTIFVALSKIAAQQAAPTENTMKHVFLITNEQAKKGFATDKVSFLSLPIMGTYHKIFRGGGGWWIEERGECSTGYGITEI